MEKKEIEQEINQQIESWLRVIRESEERDKKLKRERHKIIANTITYYERKIRKAKEWENKLLFDEEIEELRPNIFGGDYAEAICSYFKDDGSLRDYLKYLADEEKYENELAKQEWEEEEL